MRYSSTVSHGSYGDNADGHQDNGKTESYSCTERRSEPANTNATHEVTHAINQGHCSKTRSTDISGQ